MLKTAAASFIADAIRQGTGAPTAGPLTTALIGSGASLVMTRGRRPVGLVLLAAGAYLLWREARELTPSSATDPALRDPGHATASAA